MTAFPEQKQFTSQGLSAYSNVAGDFVATPTVATKNVVLSAIVSTAFSASLSLPNFSAALVNRVTSAGVVEPVGVQSITYNSGTFTLTLNQLSSNFASGDTVVMVLIGPSRAYSLANDWIKVGLETFIAGENTATNRMMVEQYFRPLTLAVSGTTALQVIPGFLHRVIGTGGTSGTVKVYDGIDATGVLILDYDGVNFFNDEVNTTLASGLTIVSSANTKLTFIVR